MFQKLCAQLRVENHLNDINKLKVHIPTKSIDIL